jgi:hypothetical protein
MGNDVADAAADWAVSADFVLIAIVIATRARIAKKPIRTVNPLRGPKLGFIMLPLFSGQNASMDALRRITKLEIEFVI